MTKYAVPALILAAAVAVFILYISGGEDINTGNGAAETSASGSQEESTPDPLTEEELKEIEITMSDREISTTNGVKHSVPLDEIVGGGPAKDGIPSVDNPKFISPSEASDWLDDSEPGIAFSSGGTHRFYPFQILVWHEIVNDKIDGRRILVSYCPLCLTAAVFDPVVEGERVEFGTSGKLWQSNLVMYDRKTESYWSQILGEAIRGPMTGTILPLIPSDQVRFGEWKRAFPNGEVLSRDTGALRFYGTSPYGSYFSVQNFSLGMVGDTDSRLANDAFVFGVTVGNKAKAYNIESIKQKGRVEDPFAGQTFVLEYDPDLDVVRIFKKLPNGELERFNPISGFWFSWAAAHPNTELYK